MSVTDRVIAALNICDEEAIRSFYSPYIKIWQNIDQKLQCSDDNMKSMRYAYGRLKKLN
jgi:hypothetical protein